MIFLPIPNSTTTTFAQHHRRQSLFHRKYTSRIPLVDFHRQKVIKICSEFRESIPACDSCLWCMSSADNCSSWGIEGTLIHVECAFGLWAGRVPILMLITFLVGSGYALKAIRPWWRSLQRYCGLSIFTHLPAVKCKIEMLLEDR